MHKRLIFSLAFALSFIIVSPSSAKLDQRISDEIIILCEQLLMDYAVYRDHLDADGFAGIFTDDAYVLIGDKEYIGATSLYKYIKDHSLPPKAHMIMFTSSEITPISLTQATGEFYAVILGSDRHVGAQDKPVQTKGIGAANVYHVGFRFTDNGWKISQLKLEGLFRGPR